MSNIIFIKGKFFLLLYGSSNKIWDPNHFLTRLLTKGFAFFKEPQACLYDVIIDSSADDNIVKVVELYIY